MKPVFFFFFDVVWKIRSMIKNFLKSFEPKFIRTPLHSIYRTGIDPSADQLCELLQTETKVQSEGLRATWLCMMFNPSTYGFGRCIEET